MKTSEFQKQMFDKITIIKDQADDLIGLTMDELNWKENSNKWSILECIEHLNRYNDYYLQEVENNFIRSPQRVDRQLISTWIGQKSIGMMRPSNQKKQKTFKKMNPANSSLGADAFKRFLYDQQRLNSLLENLSEVDANAKVIKVEFFKLLKMTIAETLEFLIVHEQRHLLQALNVKASQASSSRVSSLVV